MEKQKMIYDSKALTLEDWEATKEHLLEKGWEYIKTSQGVVYIRHKFEEKVNG